MLLHQFENEKLSQFSYIVACKKSKEAVIIDPERNIQRYKDYAQKEGLNIVGALDTHIHADYLSGLQAFAEEDVHVYGSGEGGEDWQYEWFSSYDETTKLKHGDELETGNIVIKAEHTPGHTPEHLTYIVVDKARSREPFAALTGDFLFVGDVGRPDLLETAAGHKGDMEPSAKRLYSTIKSFEKYKESLLILPGHGSGSACGKSLGDVKYTTLGYEQRNSPALQHDTEESFVKFILEDQPTPPRYFKHMKRRNKEGAGVKELKDLEQAEDLSDVVILDTRSKEEYQKGHLEGSIHAPFDTSFHQTAGSYLEPEQKIVLIAENPLKVQQELYLIGFEKVVGYTEPQTQKKTTNMNSVDDIDILLDVRSQKEHGENGLAESININYKGLPDNLDKLDKDKKILVYCASGARSTKASSYLEHKGYTVKNLKNGLKT